MRIGKVAALAAACAGPLAVRADPGVFRTAAGVDVPTPAIAGLDCDGMRAILDALDASGYRRGAPEPVDQADMALLDYEDRLSAVFFRDCVEQPAHASAPETAFGFIDGADGQ